MQSQEELEAWYRVPDPWGYTTNPEDEKRKRIILSYLEGTYKKALDVGAGEGFITKDLPAKTIHALELSDTASNRLPSNVTRVLKPTGKYDLVIATGVLYPQYDWQVMLNILKQSTGTILTCNILDWEQGIEQLGTPVVDIKFPYRNYIEHLCVYHVATS